MLFRSVAAVGRHQELLDTNEQYRNVLAALAAADDDDDDASNVAEASDVAR